MITDLWSRIKKRYEQGGIVQVIFKIFAVSLRTVRNLLINAYFRVRPTSKFTFRGKAYRYFWHTYNKTWNSERAVELSIIRGVVKEAQRNHKKILEVGNVLKHYFFGMRHDVLDKYEKVKGAMNVDVVDFSPHDKYDLIVSISTMEHVGWDEKDKRPEKVIDGFSNLIHNCLKKGGMLVVTLPIGYNPYLDQFMREGKIKFSKLFCMRRISRDNKWIEINCGDAKNIEYGKPFPNANTLLIGFYQK